MKEQVVAADKKVTKKLQVQEQHTILNPLSEISGHIASSIFLMEGESLYKTEINSQYNLNEIQNLIIITIVKSAITSVKNAGLGKCDFIQLNSENETIIIMWAAVNEVIICSLFSSATPVARVNLTLNKTINEFLHLKNNSEFLERAEKKPNIVARFVTSDDHTINQMLKLSKIKTTDRLYDLGCGDAKVLIYAAKNYNVNHSIGIECRKEVVALAQKKIRKSKLRENITIINDDLFNIPLQNADVVFIYLSKRAGKKLSSLLINTLPENSRIVSQAFPLRYMQPDETYQDKYCKLFLYTTLIPI